MNSYVISYGIHKRNKPSGVNLLYLGYTNYNKNVYYINSRIYKTEKYLKQYFRKKRMIVRGRGTERVRVGAKTIINLINKNNEEIGNDEIVNVKRSSRNNKKQFLFEEGDTVFLKWNKEDVKEHGGIIGVYPATIKKIMKNSIDVTYEDSHESIIPKEIFNKKIVLDINK